MTRLSNDTFTTNTTNIAFGGSYVCSKCWKYTPCGPHDCGAYIPIWNNQTESDPVETDEEEMSPYRINEEDLEQLTSYRAARDLVYRTAQTKKDAAFKLRTLATSLDAESDELVAELNQGVPILEDE